MKHKKLFAWSGGLFITAIIVYLLLGNLGNHKPPSELSAIIYSPPENYYKLDVSISDQDNTIREVSAAILKYLRSNSEQRKITVQFADNGNRSFLLVNMENGTIEERVLRDTGTKVRTVWPGNVIERLKLASTSGSFHSKQFAPPQQSNLYH
jgi:hypothetical protein